MSRKPENTFRAGVHKYLPAELHWEKMNNAYSSGTADNWYDGTKADLWIEWKYLPRVPKRGTIWLCKPDIKSPGLSRLQQKWLRDRYVNGRNVCVIAGCPDGGVILCDLAWEQPMTADEFRSKLLSRKLLAEWIIKTTMR